MEIGSKACKKPGENVLLLLLLLYYRQGLAYVGRHESGDVPFSPKPAACVAVPPQRRP